MTIVRVRTIVSARIFFVGWAHTRAAIICARNSSFRTIYDFGGKKKSGRGTCPRSPPYPTALFPPPPSPVPKRLRRTVARLGEFQRRDAERRRDGRDARQSEERAGRGQCSLPVRRVFSAAVVPTVLSLSALIGNEFPRLVCS